MHVLCTNVFACSSACVKVKDQGSVLFVYLVCAGKELELTWQQPPCMLSHRASPIHYTSKLKTSSTDGPGGSPTLINYLKDHSCTHPSNGPLGRRRDLPRGPQMSSFVCLLRYSASAHPSVLVFKHGIESGHSHFSSLFKQWDPLRMQFHGQRFNWL